MEMLKFGIQSDICQERIDVERSFYACSNANYMPNNNFSIPGHQKWTLTPKSDREGIICGFNVGVYGVKRLEETRDTGSRHLPAFLCL
jgi:hypothetical protein